MHAARLAARVSLSSNSLFKLTARLRHHVYDLAAKFLGQLLQLLHVEVLHVDGEVDGVLMDRWGKGRKKQKKKSAPVSPPGQSPRAAGARHAHSTHTRTHRSKTTLTSKGVADLPGACHSSISSDESRGSKPAALLLAGSARGAWGRAAGRAEGRDWDADRLDGRMAGPGA